MRRLRVGRFRFGDDHGCGRIARCALDRRRAHRRRRIEGVRDRGGLASTRFGRAPAKLDCHLGRAFHLEAIGHVVEILGRALALSNADPVLGQAKRDLDLKPRDRRRALERAVEILGREVLAAEGIEEGDVVRNRLGLQALAVVELPQIALNLGAVRIDPKHLLADRDGVPKQADALVLADRLEIGADPFLSLADPHEEIAEVDVVVRIDLRLAQQPAHFLYRLLHLPVPGKLLGLALGEDAFLQSRLREACPKTLLPGLSTHRRRNSMAKRNTTCSSLPARDGFGRKEAALDLSLRSPAKPWAQRRSAEAGCGSSIGLPRFQMRRTCPPPR